MASISHFFDRIAAGAAIRLQNPGKISNPSVVRSEPRQFSRDGGALCQLRYSIVVSIDSTIYAMNTDLLCFSHLRWNFVYQRPQHLMSRFARQGRVFFIEEPKFDSTSGNNIEVKECEDGLQVVVPHLNNKWRDREDVAEVVANLLTQMMSEQHVRRYIAWFYTPMFLPVQEKLPEAELVLYDCMDELSAFKNAPPDLIHRERLLFERADLVFTGGYSLYHAKKDFHADIHPFPSSIDQQHFGKARETQPALADQDTIPTPRIGFFGVIDERLDIGLLGEMAGMRPDWHFIVIGPTVKIDPETLPKNGNIHYLGSKSYNELPQYLAGWDVAMIPFALNESTKFISPTKTPEYLAGGKPVVATPIQDIVDPYGKRGLVRIAATAEEFVKEIEDFLSMDDTSPWLGNVDRFLERNSWDITWEKMLALINSRLIAAQLSYLPVKNRNYV